jgi:hypothetical protein
MPAKTDSNNDIAKRANAKARADFATWLMMAKLGSIEVLPGEAQNFLAGYRQLLAQAKASEKAASEITIQLIYTSYYSAMGGTGTPPDIKLAGAIPPMPERTDNVTPFRKIAKPDAPKGPPKKRPLPVGLIFIGLILLAVGYNYLSRGLF